MKIDSLHHWYEKVFVLHFCSTKIKPPFPRLKYERKGWGRGILGWMPMYFLIEMRVNKCLFSSPPHHLNEGNVYTWELEGGREPKVGRTVFGRRLSSSLLQDEEANTKIRLESRGLRCFILFFFSDTLFLYTIYFFFSSSDQEMHKRRLSEIQTHKKDAWRKLIWHVRTHRKLIWAVITTFSWG